MNKPPVVCLDPENAEDLAAFEQRAREPDLDFEEVVKALRRRGKI